MSFDMQRPRFRPKCVCRDVRKADETCGTDERHAGRWRSDTPCNRMQLTSESRLPHRVHKWQKLHQSDQSGGVTRPRDAQFKAGFTEQRRVERRAFVGDDSLDGNAHLDEDRLRYCEQVATQNSHLTAL